MNLGVLTYHGLIVPGCLRSLKWFVHCCNNMDWTYMFKGGWHPASSLPLYSYYYSSGSLKKTIPFKFVSLSYRSCPNVISLSFLWQRCYEHKQYRNGLKFCKQILSNPKFAEHGGKQQICGCRDGQMNEKILLLSPCTVPLTVCFTVIPLQRPWRWRAWPWTVWGRRRRPMTWWEEACAMTSGAMSVSLLMAWHTSFSKGDVFWVKGHLRLSAGVSFV